MSRKIKDLTELVRLRAGGKEAARGYVFLAEGESAAARLSYRQLDRLARALAVRLQQRRAAGERVLLLFPAGLEFVVAFFACLYAGAVAVPAYPPRRRRIQQRLLAIARDAEPSICLTTPTLRGRVETVAAKLPGFAGVEWLEVPELEVPELGLRTAELCEQLDSDAQAWTPPTIDADTLAFLQYTSGSTGDPKGVRVTHGHLLHNEALIQRAFGTDEASVVVGWLPLYHDMGLIGNVLQPLYAGAECVLMSPMAFLQRPRRWLEAVSRYRATISGGPNFAYDLCAERVRGEDRDGLDLSSWRVAFNGAEPVRAETLHRFADAFAPCGFDARAFFPCYGLAEATLFVSGSVPGQGAVSGRFAAAALEQDRAEPATLDEDAEVRELVASGVPVPSMETADVEPHEEPLRVEIVDPESRRRLEAGRVGEIWVAGRSVAGGYWQRPEQSVEDFEACLAEADPAVPRTSCLRTGDLGFVDAEGRLYVTGRRKDLILIHGRNLYPHDLERIAEASHPQLRTGGSAAFLADREVLSDKQHSEPGLVLVLEVDRRAELSGDLDAAAVEAAVRRAVADEFELALARVVLIQAGTLPKTSSGKVRRRATRQALLDGTLTVVADAGVRPAAAGPVEGEVDGEIESYLRLRLARQLGVDPQTLDLARPLLEQGLDSLRALQLVSEVETELGVRLAASELLDGLSVAELAQELADKLATALASGGGVVVDATEAPTPGEAGYGDPGEDADALYPLSHGQEALWFLHRLAPDSAAYHIAAAARLSSGDKGASIDPQQIQRALLTLVRRHGALRTRFEDDGRQGGQRLASPAEVEATPEAFLDWAVLQRERANGDALARRLAEEAARPFDLARPPLLRVRLLPLSSELEASERDEYALLLVVHHAVADFWSLAVLLRELGEELQRSAADVDGELDQRQTLRYVDYAHWQRRRLAAEGDALAAWWLDRLGPSPPELDILPDRPRPPVQGFRGAQVATTLPADATTALDVSTRASGATLYMALLAAWQTVLGRWAGSTEGQERVLVGSPISGRGHASLQGLVGYCVQPLVLDGRLDPGDSWARRLRHTRATALDAFRHADYPFELLVQRLQVRRHPDRPPLFQAWLALQQAPPFFGENQADLGPFALGPFALGREGGRLRLGGLDWHSLPLPPLASQFELSLLAAPLAGTFSQGRGGPRLGLTLVYDPDLFDATTAARLLGQVRRLLERVPAHADAQLASLSLLGRGEAHQLLHEWNDTARPRVRAEASVLAPIEARLRAAPEAVALVAGRRHMSGGELARRVTALAATLLEGRVVAEEPIGLLVDRGPEMVIAVLGVLAAGAAYLPLDPAYPLDRLAYMVADAGARCLLTRTSLRRRAEELVDEHCDILDLDAIGSSAIGSSAIDSSAIDSSVGVPTPSASWSDRCLGATQLAYVLYTSGSTGRPKGVQIAHGALGNFLDAMAGLPLSGLSLPGTGVVSERDSWLAVTTLAFDIAGLELFLPLRSGARLVLASPADVADGSRLAARLAEQRCSVLQATPATWRLLLESGWNAGAHPWQRGSRLTRLCGGEALPASLARQLTSDGGRLWNLYGPTESTIWSAARRVTPDETPVRVGGLLANTDLHLLTGFDCGRPRRAPLGVPGEVTLGGAGLARGYRGRPALTAERFVPHPFASSEAPCSGARLYCVGDLARQRGDGTLEFLGRLDHQVKLRGFRIELGEIEAALEALPQVAQAVVAVQGEDASARLVAYLITSDAASADGAFVPPAAELRDALRQQLPDYMLPAIFVPVEALPLTANGKVDRQALARLQPASPTAPPATTQRVAAVDDLEARLRRLWHEVLTSEGGSAGALGITIALEDIGRHDNFFDLGGHSLLVARLQRRLADEWQRPDVSVVDLFRHPTLAAQAELLRGAGPLATASDPRASTERAASPDSDKVGDIAIIGMAGRFPGAEDVDTFWRMLETGTEAIRFFTPDELRERVPAELLDDPAYVPARGVLEGAEDFDAAFFGYTPREAEILDPQHRVFLECAWHALEHAGYVSGKATRRCSLYAGVGMNTYLLQAGEARLTAAAGGYQAFIANDKDFVPTRVSYQLDLRGPSINVQTACSSSLTAVHLACRGLASGEADMALAGGVTVRVPQLQGYLYEEGGILSADGHCRPFDAEAGGTVLGNGTGVVVLKPLARAQADGDCVLAVIKGSAINNDGALKMGYTAPGVEGQAAVIAEALAAAGVEPSTVGYVETHGTGTRLGDPIEISALRQAYEREAYEGQAYERQAYEGQAYEGQASGSAGKGSVLPRGGIALGSVKSNIGHLDTAAGIAGLIKTVQALRHRRLPPSLHFQRANPELRLDDSPFRVQAEAAPWPAPVALDGSSDEGRELPRRAGISSFGIGGTNVHMILEEAPLEVPQNEPPSWNRRLLLLSARTEPALDAATRNLGRALRQTEQEDPKQERELRADSAYTLQVGRKSFAHRRWLLSEDLSKVDADSTTAQALLDLDPERLREGKADSERHGPTPVVFLLSGQGSQYPGMGRRCYQVEPSFRDDIDRGAELLLSRLEGVDLRTLLLPEPDDSGQAAILHESAAEQLRRTRYTQPALVLLEVALGRLWQRWGVQPAALLGHSIGELAAACLAGVFSFDDALTLAAARGRLMDAQPAGAMLGVGVDEPATRALLARHPGLDLAAINGPEDCVIAGPEAAIEALVTELEARSEKQGEQIRHRRLHTSHAFHARAMVPAADAFAAAVERVPRAAPRIPFVSNLSGTWITDAEAVDPTYWGRQLARPVRFAAGVETVLADTLRERGALLEVGPGRALVNLSRGILTAENHAGTRRPAPAIRSVATLPHPKDADDEDSTVLRALGSLWAAGAEIDWVAFYQGRGERRRRRPLPGYAFQRRRFWLGPETLVGKLAEQAGLASAGKPAADPLAPRTDVGDWFYTPSWQLAPVPPRASIAPGSEPETWLVLSAGPRGDALAERLQESAPGQPARSIVTVTPDPALSSRAGWRHFLQSSEKVPSRLVHAWALDQAGPERTTDDFDTLLALASALAGMADGGGSVPKSVTPDIVLLSQGGRRLHAAEVARPAPALLAGLLRALPAETGGDTGSRVRWVDVPQFGEAAVSEAWDEVLDDLCLELHVPLTGKPLTSEPGTPVEEIAWRGGERWRASWQSLSLSRALPLPAALDAQRIAVPVRAGGTYLITGGFGGVGLALARALANLATKAGEGDPVRLLLLGRTVPTSSLEIEGSRGRPAEVVPLQADVADAEALTAALREALDGSSLDGVLHAAGVAGGGALSMRDPAAAAAVLRPKVDGVQALASALDALQLRPDFIVFCSSINSTVGGYGQADYAAANAYLDAWAEARAPRPGRKPRIVSLAWDRWAGVGMAAGPVVDLLPPVPPPPAAGAGQVSLSFSPLLGTCLLRAPERDLYRAVFRPEEQWVLSEHQIAGRPTVPGATYLEMARAALVSRLAASGGGPGEPGKIAGQVEVRDVTFLELLTVAKGAAREVWTVLEVAGDLAGTPPRATDADTAPHPGQPHWAAPTSGSEGSGGGAPLPRAGEDGRRPGTGVRGLFSFRILSRPLDGGAWHTHVQGQAAVLKEPEHPAPLDLAALRAACPRRLRDVQRSEFLVTGPHWQALDAVYLGDGELLAELRLSADLAEEARRLPLHPSLLDIGTGFAQLARDGDFLPLAYERLRLFEPAGLGETLVSHVRLRASGQDADATGQDTLRCDVVLAGLDGRVRATVEGFAMQRVRPEALARLQAEDGSQQLDATTVDPNERRHARAARAVLDGVIDETSAADVLARVLAAPRLPARLVVSPRPFDAVARAYADFRPAYLVEQLATAGAGVAAGGVAGERPELETAYVAPADELERVVAEVWQRTLAIDRIGIHDNFFELGGTSLIGVQVVAELRRRLEREIATVSLFEAPTVATLARLLAPPAEDDEPAFSATRRRAELKKAALANRGPARRGPAGRRSRGRRER